MGKLTVVEDTNKFHETVDKVLKEGSDNIFVTFVSTKNPDGTFWCPDCQASDPIFTEVFKETGCTVVECVIPREGYKGNPDHPYRKDSQIQLKCIPTIIAWSKSGPSDRLIDNECSDLAKVSSFVKSHL